MYLLHRAPEAHRLQTLLQRMIDMPGAGTVIWGLGGLVLRVGGVGGWVVEWVVVVVGWG